ncbi:MAG: DUF5689 domain-containing protein [Flaviramulus sp.]|nr:DUF5689 domain-containing protein [Flaviramulus sp.]
MKNIKKLLILLGILMIASCVNDYDYGIPIPGEAENVMVPANKITTFRAIKQRFDQAINNGNLITTIDVDEEIYLEGYVVSSDAAGNFFEELIIQNKTDASNPDNDPRLGFRIDINVSSLSETFEFGRKVYIKLSGLTIGKSNGILTIAKGEGQRLEQIQEFEYRNIIIRTQEVVSIIPKSTTLINLTEADRNTLIKLDNMQLNRFELGATYASESIDQFDGLRTLENCDSGVSIIMQTSTFSNFRTLIIPQGKGSITGVFSRDFGDDFNVLIPNSAVDVDFTNTERCDPLELDCGLAETIGTQNLFYEDFETQSNNRLIEISGWTNYIEVGSEGWEGYSSTSSNASLGRSARVQPASSGDLSNIAWLITPPIDLDAYNNLTLQFKTSNSLADSSFLEVLYSLDWDGIEANITSANWGVLSAAYVVKDTDSFVQWFNSGNVNLYCSSGTMYIAFKYTGGGIDTFDGIYELDEISVDYLP